MVNAENAKPPLSGVFFTKTGQMLSRPLKHAHQSLAIPMNAGDNRLFLKNGELVTPFVTVKFRHVKNVACAGFMLAIYEEYEAAEFDPTGMVPVPVRSLEKDFEELNSGVEL